MIYRVIVADSSPAVRRAVEMAFPEAVFELFFFDNGLELVKALPDIHPDALLISLSLPGMDGYRAAGVLRGYKEMRQTTLFFLRGAFEKFETDKAAGLDYEGVMRKPFDSEGLAGRVKDSLDRKRDLLGFPQAPFDIEGRQPANAANKPVPAAESPASLTGLIRAEVKHALAETEERLRAEFLGRPKNRRAKEKK